MAGEKNAKGIPASANGREEVGRMNCAGGEEKRWKNPSSRELQQKKGTEEDHGRPLLGSSQTK